MSWILVCSYNMTKCGKAQKGINTSAKHYIKSNSFLFNSMISFIVKICNVSYIKLCSKPNQQVNEGTAAYVFTYLFNSQHFLWHCGVTCFYKSSHKLAEFIPPKKPWIVHLWRKRHAVWICSSDSCRTSLSRYFKEQKLDSFATVTMETLRRSH